MTASPDALRNDIISKALSAPASARTEIATMVKERSVPLIHTESEAISARPREDFLGVMASTVVRGSVVVAVIAMGAVRVAKGAPVGSSC
jgi:hypothetical protein